MVANIRNKELVEKLRNGRKARSDQEVILKLLTFEHNTSPRPLRGLRRKDTITATHAVDSF